ncbi:MAG: amidohydrolase family protein [Saprospiraceae bacterium]|nr:amidohydrolase family protein [Saprospiraceae bacterium]
MKSLFFTIFSFLLIVYVNAQTYAIRNVNVIPMDAERVLSDQTVIIEKGKISKIGAVSEIKIPRKATVVDGSGKYLIPGLMDMHMHFFTEQGLDAKFLPEEAKLPLVNGVTTARVMNGDSLYLDLKKKIAKGEIAGPELFVASPQLVGKWGYSGPFFGQIVKSRADAANAVRRFKKEGYDEIKITFFVYPEQYDAIVQTAKEVGIKVTGHVGPDVGLDKSLAAKQQNEHMDEFLEQLLPDTASSKISVSGTNIWNRQQAWPTVDYLEESKIPALVQRIKDAGIAVSPTSHFLHSSFSIGQSEDYIRQSPDFQYIPQSFHKARFDTRNFFWQNAPTESRRDRFRDLRNQITVALHQAGVPLLCGSDSPEWFIVQGFSVHYELEALMNAGLSPYAALQTATINTAHYLGISDRKGTISIGKDADLVLLKANPLENIQHTKSIKGVFRQGKFYNETTLNSMLEEAKILGKQ